MGRDQAERRPIETEFDKQSTGNIENPLLGFPSLFDSRFNDLWHAFILRMLNESDISFYTCGTNSIERHPVVLSGLLMFASGLFGANALPHFVSGITKSSYPMIFSNRPVPNLLAGWVSFVIAGLLWMAARPEIYPVPAFIACAIGALLMGLFHAGPGAFGRKDPDRERGAAENPSGRR